MSVQDQVVEAVEVEPVVVGRRDRLARVGAAAGLAVVAWVHAPLVPEHWQEVPYLGLAFAVLVMVSAGLAGSLLVESATPVWVLALLLTAGSAVLYAVSRSVGLPGAGDDVGDWADPAGLLAVGAELLVAATATVVLLRRRRPT